MKLGGHVAGLFEKSFRDLNWHELDEFADAELLLANHFDSEHAPFGIEIQHHKATVGSEWLGACNLSLTKTNVGGRRFGIDFYDRRFGDRDDESGEVSSSIR